MTGGGPVYEVLALRYATHEHRPARQSFLVAEDPDAVVPLDYYVWAVRGPDGRVVVVDTGMAADAPARRPGRTILRGVDDALRAAGIDAAEVDDVVLTHLHYDHAGGLGLFPRAGFHVQDAEVAHCTGRAMGEHVLRRSFDVDDVVAAVRHVHAGRMRFHQGTAEIADGVTVHLVGGHTAGLQVVRVPTARGWVVLASDAAHLWANIGGRNPFPDLVDVAAVLEGYRTLEALADGPDHVIPGHDPLVRTRFTPLPGDPDTVRLDVAPTLDSPLRKKL